MKTEIDDLKNIWNVSKNSIPSDKNPEIILAKAEAGKRQSIMAHATTISILLVTIVAIAFYYLFVMRYNSILSHIGFGLMCLALIIRIIVEMSSVLKAKSIMFTNNAAENIQQTANLIKQRTRIHGSFTTIMVALYVIGFVLIAPEMYRNLPFYIFMGICLFFVIGAVILILVGRKGIHQELNNLKKVTALKEDIE